MYTTIPGDCKGGTATRRRRRASTTPASATTSTSTSPASTCNCSDHADRLPEWEREFRAYERALRADRRDPLPRLTFMRLPNDHTARHDARASATPQAYMADNDLALGRLVDVVSHSRVLEEHGDLRHRGRRPERARPHRRPPHARLRHQPVHAARPRRLHALRHRRHGRHDRGPARAAADDDHRPARGAHVEGLQRTARTSRPTTAIAADRHAVRRAGRAAQRRRPPRWRGRRRAGTSRSRTRRRRSRSTRRSGSRSTARDSRAPAPRHDYIVGSMPTED